MLIHRSIYLAAYPGPTWTCHFCDAPVTDAERHRNGLVVHHLDEDQTNNDLTNLTPAHLHCHSEHHMTGRARTEAQKAKLRSPKSAETRARMSAAQQRRGPRRHSDETKAKLSAIVTGRRYPDDVRARMRAARQQKRNERSS